MPNMTKFTLAFVISLISFFSLSQENLYEVSLYEKIDSSDIIVFGKVVGASSHWEASGKMIYTSNSVEIYTVYKGQFQQDTVVVETVGGRVGSTMVTTSALLELKLNDIGVFFLTKKSTGEYDVFSSKQGFLKPDYSWQKFICPFYSESVQSTISSIKSRSGMKEKVVKPFAIPSGFNKSSSSGVCISPGTISAGTNSVLSITGFGFGTSGPSATDKVLFPSADDGGSPIYFESPLWTYQSWSDTLIELIVPTDAGTGPVRVEITGSTYESDSVLTIPYSILNNGNGSIRRMVGQNLVNGQTWTFGNNMNSSMSGGIGDIPFESAVDTWKCATGVNWTIAPASVPLTDADANDGINLVSLNLFLPNGVLGVCYTYATNCNSTDWYITGQDILFDFLTIWNVGSYPPGGNQVDFESVSLHELGHAHVLAHVVDNDDAMHYSIGPGVMKRTLNASNIIAGNLVMNLCENQPVCSQIAVTEAFLMGCSEPSLTDVGIISMTEIPDDSTCFGLLPIHLSFGNWGSDTVTQIEWKVRINGIVAATSIWSGSLTMNEEVFDFYVGDFDFQDSSYLLEIWAESVNGLLELDPSNDSISYTFHPTSCSPNDASVRLTTSLDSSLCIYNADIIGTLINPGENILNSCRIYIEANGVLVDSVDWTGSVIPGDSVENIVITNYAFSQDENEFIIWSGLPNGVPDTYSANDTSSTYYFNKLRLEGTYTIGGASPDISTISEAFYRLSQYGICGDVILNIRDGLYLERLQLDSIPSSSPNYHVTIQSENMDANLVSIKNTDVLPQEPGLSLNNTDNLTIRHIRFLTNDPMPQIQTSIEVKNGCKNIRITDNLFILDTIAPNYVAPCIDLEPVNQLSQTLQNITIARNRFENYRSCIEGTTSSFNTGYAERLFIQENDLIGHRNEAINIQHFGKVYITNNRSISNSESGPPYSGGIHVEQWIDTVVISGNYIIDSVASTALQVQYFQGAPASSVLRVFNNSITHVRDNGFNFPRPTVVISGAPNFDFNHNTIYSFYPPNYFQYDDPVLELLQPSPVNGNVMNNIFVGKGGVNQVINSTIAYNSSNNVLWFDGGTYPIEPVFASDTYLVPMNSFELDNMGSPISYITTDIEETQRSTTTPDVGAYEFHPFDYDIEIDHTSLFQDTLICPNDSLELFFIVTNNGTQQIDSFYVYWAVANGTYDSIQIYQTILPQQSETINLGYQSFSNAYTTIDVTCDLPNGFYDSLQYNNSHTFTFYTRLSGSYTVGDPTADIPTMEDVMLALDKGLCGPVVFNLLDGDYESFGVLDYVPNSSSVNTVTFQSASMDTGAVHIAGSPSLWSVRVLGMRYVNFKHLTFLDYVVLDSTSVIKFDSCRFQSSGFVHANQFSLLTNDLVDSLSILNSHLIDSDILFDYTPVFVTNFELRNNVIEGFSEIILDAFNNSSNHSNIVISENVISPLGLNSFDAAIFIDAYTNVEVSRNYITCGPTTAIEFVYGSTGSIIKNNMIKSDGAGFSLTACTNLKVYSNSILAANGVKLFSNASVYFKNNIVQKTTPTQFFFYFNFTSQVGIPELYTDNNLFYGDLTNFTYEVGTPFISYAQWKSSYNKDLNSIDGPPGFISLSDLHVNSSIADSAGISLPEVLFDFDGEPRNALFPDVGADEFDLDISGIFDISVDEINHPSLDSCFVEDSIVFTLSNNYSDTLFTAQIELNLDGIITTFPWSGVLLPGQSELVYLTTGNFTPGIIVPISISISQPNGSIDFYSLNNTASLDYLPYDGVHIESVCDGDATLTASSADASTQYLWDSGEITSVISIDSVTQHWVQGTNSYGCVSYDSIDISDVHVPTPISIFASDTVFCPGDNVAIGVIPVVPGTSYAWGNFPLDVHSYNTSSPGLISLWATDSNGCIANYTFQTFWDTLPDASFSVHVDTLFAATIDPNYTYIWHLNGQVITGANDTFYVMTQNGIYSLLVENLSCSKYSTTYNFTTLSMSEATFSLPSIYPNPASNELWIKNISEYYTFRIYDSQGRVVLTKIDNADTKININALSSGSYFISILTRDGEFHFQFFKGL